MLQESNITEIRKIGHKLAGNAGSYGLSDLGAIGVKLEENDTIANIIPLLNEYEKLLEVYLSALSIKKN